LIVGSASIDPSGNLKPATLNFLNSLAMEIDPSQVQGLPVIYQALLALLAGCVIGGLVILTYVGIRAGFHAWTEWRIKRLNRETWFRNKSAYTAKSP
jgi:hypothetical protein